MWGDVKTSQEVEGGAESKAALEQRAREKLVDLLPVQPRVK